MKDLIDRQAAIDEVYETFCYAYCDNCDKEMNEDLCGDCHRKYNNWAASKATIERVINALPSAQPEIIRCKDCKNQEKFFQKDGRRKDGGYYIYGCSLAEGYSHVCLDDDYCSRAERRTE